MQIQISWLLQKPTDLDLHCLQSQGISGFSRTRVYIGGRPCHPSCQISIFWQVLNTVPLTCLTIADTSSEDQIFCHLLQHSRYPKNQAPLVSIYEDPGDHRKSTHSGWYPYKYVVTSFINTGTKKYMVNVLKCHTPKFLTK